MNAPSHVLAQSVKDTMAFVLLSLQLEDGEMGYAYVAMPADKTVIFFRQFGGRELALPDYVTVLHQGYGETPPEEVRAWFFDTYGMES